MKKISLLSMIAAGLLFSSCGAFKSYVASYSIGLTAVESPADAKQQFGETRSLPLMKAVSISTAMRMTTLILYGM